MSSIGEKCDHDPCHCVTRAPDAVGNGKSIFCSVECSRGEGCNHPGCDCASEASTASA